MLDNHPVVSSDQWLEARKQLLAKEKEFTRLRDQITAQQRALPWEAVTKEYVFEGAKGRQTLADLFDGRSQLIVYHFMFDPDWDEGCKSCSFWADQFDAIPVHLAHRDVTLVAVSRAPYVKLDAYRKRMGWAFTWVSSGHSDFNTDYHVSFTPEEVEKKSGFYNFATTDPFDTERHGLSVFYKDPAGKIFHTYSTYGRGTDMLNGAYNYLDLAPKGRDEGEGPMGWLRRHDAYDRD